MKGYLIAQGWTLEKTHDMVALLEASVNYDAEWGAMVADGAVLNEYIVAGRYPGDIVFEEIGRTEAVEALDIARRIRDRARNLIG